MAEQLPLKYEKIEPKYLIRGDIILHEGELWQMALKNASIFLNLGTKEQKEITRQWDLRVGRLELIPHEWKVVDGKVHLKGQQLGLEPLHDIQIEGMRTFDQMQIVKSQAEKGKKYIIRQQRSRPIKKANTYQLPSNFCDVIYAVILLQLLHKLMNSCPYPKTLRFVQHESKKPNIFNRCIVDKQRRKKQTILSLLHREQMFEHQNNKEMISNTKVFKDRKKSSSRLKINLRIRQILGDNTRTLTPKFRRQILSQSKLPLIQRRERVQLKQHQALTPWDQKESKDLLRPHSSKYLGY